MLHNAPPCSAWARTQEEALGGAAKRRRGARGPRAPWAHGALGPQKNFFLGSGTLSIGSGRVPCTFSRPECLKRSVLRPFRENHGFWCFSRNLEALQSPERPARTCPGPGPGLPQARRLPETTSGGR